MTSRTLVFDHFGIFLKEISIGTTPRTWVLNDYGKADFPMEYDPNQPQSGQDVREELLQFGNLIHIVHVPSEEGGQLPTWTGIILPPQTWDEGTINVTAYSAESILMLRAMTYEEVEGNPAQVFKRIIEIVNSRATNIPINLGIVDDYDGNFPDSLRTNAYDHIKKLCRDSGMSWKIRGKISEEGSGYSLSLYADLKKKSSDNTQKLLTGNIANLNNQNTESSSPLYKLQGTPYNEIFGYSQAQTDNTRWGPIRVVNQGALDDYGPFQLNQIIMGKKDPTSVETAGRSLVETRGRPVKMTRKTALDKGDLFSNLAVGNYVSVKDDRVGFGPNGTYGYEATARIVSLDYNDTTNKAPLNLEIF